MVEPLEPNHCGLLAQRGACYPIQPVLTRMIGLQRVNDFPGRIAVVGLQVRFSPWQVFFREIQNYALVAGNRPIIAHKWSRLGAAYI